MKSCTGKENTCERYFDSIENDASPSKYHLKFEQINIVLNEISYPFECKKYAKCDLSQINREMNKQIGGREKGTGEHNI